MPDHIARAASSLDKAIDQLVELDNMMKREQREQAEGLWRQAQSLGIKIRLDTRLARNDCELVIGSDIWNMFPRLGEE